MYNTLLIAHTRGIRSVIFLRKMILWGLLGLSLFIAGCGEQKPLERPNEREKVMTEPTISVYMHETGQTEVMELETYIEGVVGGEMRNDWPVEALAAQAILARTFTMQAFERGAMTSKGTNASTDIKEFQAYNAANVNDTIREAVRLTRGEIAVWQGMPIHGWFHASAGGQTTAAKTGLDYPKDEPPFIKSVRSPDELAPEDVKNWQVQYSLAEIMKILEGLGEEVQTITSVSVGNRDASGRAVTLVFNGNIEISGPRFRIAADSTRLKSMLLDDIEITDNMMVFRGHGYGHGVGMSQWGAYKLALDGKSPEEIVKYYFKNIKIEKRW